ncbi:uncharacterized protein LOC117646514 [Thrips palmi]|uniref:Uncharacterized protein LOC117646514 n=1 Tax=Thrips palmi TaxID=161013 RepID=A0A6P8Z8U2_THRPL|nr:uncharacterized protein LOC117646514 [Thrips palmi]XP_034243426.1 uncharacterized protein LOC117646514 [Thrips palmi]XP_034243434.1 uncharacterized protein LOC117646514 [Thrips palmi]XP_034243443.1 uncharacterized protein LOC117646514 [Thrips palmi]
MVHSEFLSLPDDALLVVLAFLTPRELFACRTVCRRLRDICEHRDLWRKVHVWDDDAGVLLAALAVAPCLKGMHLSSPLAALDLASLVPGSTCVVDGLSFDLATENDVLLAIDVLLHLSSVGGVRELYIEWGGEPPVKTLTKLAEAICSLPGLLYFDFHYPFEEPLQVTLRNLDVEVMPTLKRLEIIGDRMDPFAEYLLKKHADTLQEVRVYFRDVPVSLLMVLPRLRSLACMSHKDLAQLSNLENLDSFELLYDLDEVPKEKDVFCPGTLKFLRRASHLKSVTMPLHSPANLSALSLSFSSAVVEALDLNCFPGFYFEGLIDVLHQFPSLRTLSVDAEPPDDFLRTISPVSLPRLATLVVYPPKNPSIRAWLHEPAIQDLLIRNPDLHLFIHNRRSRGVYACFCVWCSRGHRSSRADYSRQPVSSHKRKAGCNCFQVAVSPPQPTD